MAQFRTKKIRCSFNIDRITNEGHERSHFNKSSKESKSQKFEQRFGFKFEEAKVLLLLLSRNLSVNKCKMRLSCSRHSRCPPGRLPAHAGRPRAAKSVPMKISSNGKSSNENDERIMCQVSLMTPVCPDLVTFQNFGKNFKIIGKSTYLGKFSVG